jgi:topoisomerase IA-like protein
VESLTPERGAQLLQDKRDKGPAPPKRKAAAKRKK